MKKTFSLVLAVSLLFLFGCTKNGTTPTEITTLPADQQDVPERQTYENKEYNFTIQVPGARTFQENVFNAVVMFKTPVTEGDTITENVGIAISTLDKEYTIDDYYAITKPQLEERIAWFTEISNENLDINGIQGKKLVYKGKQGSYDIQWKETYIIKEKTLYVITYTATVDTYEQYAEKVDEIITTLEIK